ncbi:MAG: PQQ-binding-like beta-propeller repeat protein [Hamadaea sp.]|nr:PQQ-binding-like beta-propeller repeat protein [Hamadaea sp.]
MTLIDLGETGRDEPEWEPPVPGWRQRRREILAVLIGIAALLLPQASVSATAAAPPIILEPLAGVVDDVHIVGDVALGVLSETAEIAAVSLDTGELLWRHPGVEVYATDPAAGRVALVGLAGGRTPEIEVVTARTGQLVEAWPDAPPVYSHGRRVIERSALPTAVEERAVSVIDGLLQTVRGEPGDYSVTFWRPDGDRMVPLWTQQVVGSPMRAFFPCGGLVCAADRGGLSGLDPQTGKLVWAAGRFTLTDETDDLLIGRMSDALGREQNVALDPRTGVVVARLGRWHIAGTVLGRTAAYLPGSAGRAWLGTVDLTAAQPAVRARANLTAPVDRCVAAGARLVCFSGVAGQPPFALTLSPR